eukprot:scaffold1944_cov241-Pinguiococcus_pyrenoidosus.AAC.6
MLGLLLQHVDDVLGVVPALRRRFKRALEVVLGHSRPSDELAKLGLAQQGALGSAEHLAERSAIPLVLDVTDSAGQLSSGC